MNGKTWRELQYASEVAGMRVRQASKKAQELAEYAAWHADCAAPDNNRDERELAVIFGKSQAAAARLIAELEYQAGVVREALKKAEDDHV